MKKLLVYYQGWGERWLLGTLAHSEQALLFEYSAEALLQGLELSPLHLRLQPQAYGRLPAHQQGLPGLIADALPDGWGLLLMDRLFRKQGLKVASVSPLDRLAFVGDRAMGALTFEPAELWAQSENAQSLLTLAQHAQRVLAGQGAALLQQLALLGGSPQGARPKVLVHFHPQTGEFTTQPAAQLASGFESWLVKFPAQGEHAEACAVEALYADLARRCGLDMPETRHFKLGPKLAAFGIRRFDREGGRRVPVHTLAGALHADFRLTGAVDYTTFLRATRLFTRDEREVLKAYERAVFNVLFNNRDDHAKNLSFRLGQDRAWRLAPCYDLTFSAGAGGEHAMDVCGHGRDITRAHLLQLAAQGGLDAKTATQALERMASATQGLRAECGRWPIRKATINSVVAAVQRNLVLLAKG
jgi:serine/threonine-protein kinase HipA